MQNFNKHFPLFGPKISRRYVLRTKNIEILVFWMNLPLFTANAVLKITDFEFKLYSSYEFFV